MKKHELLAPAGDMECLRQAVFNGCDAVYIACKNFGARKFATNFSDDEIVAAIKFCHLYGVKIYVTMNTLVKNSEVEAFLKQVYFLHSHGVDALIVQDFGMICLLREKYPNLEIHASTQANTSSKETCQLFYDLGVKRVVFSRELSVDEIDQIDVPIEKEAFIHGALCISYSGCCLMSSMLGGRSGNRGECAGTCRLPYTLEKNGKVISDKKYLLSTKELNTSSEMNRLMDSSIYSFKIEGRMKNPLYVGFITRLYRRLIDGDNVALDQELDKLKTIFNRKFTTGRLFGESDEGLMNRESPNHLGLNIGKVIDVNDKKIKIKLDKGRKINQYDAIRFLNSKKGLVINFLYDESMKLVSSSDNVFYIDNKVGLTTCDTVSKTQDYLLNKEFSLNAEKRIGVSFRVRAKLGFPLFVEISDGVHKFSIEREGVAEAIKAPSTKEDFLKQLKKLGNTPFALNNVEFEVDEGIFVQIRLLNEIRRELVERLIAARENDKAKVEEVECVFEKFTDTASCSSKRVCCLVHNERQLVTCLDLDVSRVYVTSKGLYEKYKDDSHVYYALERCVNNIDDKLVSRNFVSDYFEFGARDIVGNYSLNVTNIYTAYYLRKLGLKSIPLSVELTESEIEKFIECYRCKFGLTLFEVMSYGRVCNMVIKGNILDIEKNIFEYNLVDFKLRKFPVYFNGVNTYILNYEVRKIQKNESYGFVRLDFYDEDCDKIRQVVKMYQ